MDKLVSMTKHALKEYSMNVSTDLKNMIHPKVYAELIQLSGELNMSPEVALFYIFNRMYMHRLGIDIPKDAPHNGIFWKHEEDVYTFVSRAALGAPAPKSEPKTAPEPIETPKTAETITVTEETQEEWYSDFPKRAQNAIIGAKIQSMEDLLANYGVEDFASLNGAGNSTALRLQEHLKTKGLKMETKSQFKKTPAAPKAADTKTKVDVSEATSARMSSKSAALKDKLEDAQIKTKPVVMVVAEDDEVAEDFYARMSSLKFNDPNDTSWFGAATTIYAQAWKMGERDAKGFIKELFAAAGVVGKDFSTWGKARDALLSALPVQDDQLELIEKYAREAEVDDLDAYVLAEMGVEGGPEALNSGEASDLMAMLNKPKRQTVLEPTAPVEDEWF